MPKLSSLILLLVMASVGAAVPPFQYDRQLAIELARAYVQSSLRAMPKDAGLQLDYDKPLVLAAVDHAGRHLVSVTFAAKSGETGGYAVLERCEETGLLVGVDAGTVNGIAAYRQQMDAINPASYVALPRVCPTEDVP